MKSCPSWQNIQDSELQRSISPCMVKQKIKTLLTWLQVVCAWRSERSQRICVQYSNLKITINTINTQCRQSDYAWMFHAHHAEEQSDFLMCLFVAFLTGCSADHHLPLSAGTQGAGPGDDHSHCQTRVQVWNKVLKKFKARLLENLLDLTTLPYVIRKWSTGKTINAISAQMYDCPL